MSNDNKQAVAGCWIILLLALVGLSHHLTEVVVSGGHETRSVSQKALNITEVAAVHAMQIALQSSSDGSL